MANDHSGAGFVKPHVPADRVVEGIDGELPALLEILERRVRDSG
jgi:hypothetical protein